MHRFLSLSFILLSLLHTQVFASSDIEKIQSMLTQSTAMSGHFEQEKKLALLSRPLSSTGDFFAASEEGIIWTVQVPVYSQLIITPDNIHFSQQVSGNVGRSMRYIGRILNAILSANLTALQQQFNISEIHVGQQQWKLTLTPKSMLMKKALNRIELNGSHHIEQVKLLENSGDYTLIKLNKIQQLSSIPSNEKKLFNAINSL